MARRRWQTIVLLVVLGGLVLGSGSARAAPTLADCDARVAANPRNAGAYYCYVIAAQSSGRYDDSILRLQAILATTPDLHRAHLNIAVLEHDLGRAGAIENYRRSIEGMTRDGDAWGLVYAHSGLGAFLDAAGRTTESEPHFDRAMEVAREKGDPMMLAHAQCRAASHADELMDYGKALRLYSEAETVVFPDGPPYLKSWILSGLGRARWARGELHRALAVYEREIAHLQATGARFNEATARYNIALIHRQLADRGQADPDLSRGLVEEALRVAIEAGHRETEGAARQLLSSLLEGRERVEESRRALEVLQQVGNIEKILLGKRNLAEATYYLGPGHRGEAWAILGEAIDEARAAEHRFSVTRGLVMRATMMTLDAAPHDRVVEAFNESIESIETIRDLQSDRSTRAKSFGEWIFVYARFADYLLRGLPSASAPRDDLELAFETIEKMRARVLLDILLNAGVPGVQDPPPGQRPSVATLSRTQERLGPGQALVAFHLASDSFGDVGERPASSWVLSVTRHDVQAFEVPERTALQGRVAVYRGMFAARDGREAVPGARLYDDLLGDVIGTLHAEIDRLIIVPDGVLHELPFGSLRPAPGSPPLADRFEIAYSPSATLWARSRDLEVDLVSSPSVLGLADPDVGVDVVGALRDAGEGFAALSATRLPHAAHEARALLRRLGNRGRVLEGLEATEAAIKTADMNSYDVLHLAAHAVVDRNLPERSAVVLAAGNDDEDGLLRMSEIAALDLDGKLVILSACRSASGELIEGEGMVGLSRAFFEAGARTVLGSLWPLRDEEIAALIEDFSREVGAGRSVAAALAETRRSRIASGAPADSWAGLVVLGDGDLVLTRPGSRRSAWPWVAFPLLALVALGWWWRRRFV